MIYSKQPLTEEAVMFAIGCSCSWSRSTTSIFCIKYSVARATEFFHRGSSVLRGKKISDSFVRGLAYLHSAHIV